MEVGEEVLVHLSGMENWILFSFFLFCFFLFGIFVVTKNVKIER